ncbi:MAG: hypothetical protein SCH71_02125 [Desulfobulbaceae bacterium]|nr:hypothetical protein [Desulfobulbaceae bacterium]
MKKGLLLKTILTLAVAAGLNTAHAQTMGEGGAGMHEMKEKQQTEKQQQYHDPDMMHPGMMGGYGMGPGMGYGMGHGMMGGYGMGPGMGYGMGHGMMGGYGMGPGMMGGYGSCPCPGAMRSTSPDQFNDFLDKTRELRKNLHSMRFDYAEMMRKPESSRDEIKNLQKEMFKLQQEIQQKAFE